jgi:hypothetical protein
MDCQCESSTCHGLGGCNNKPIGRFKVQWGHPVETTETQNLCEPCRAYAADHNMITLTQVSTFVELNEKQP